MAPTCVVAVLFEASAIILRMRTRQQTKLEAAALSENTWTSATTIPVQQEDKVSLASSLDPGPKRDLYFTCDPEKMVERLLAPQGKGASSGVGRIGGSAMSTEEVMRSSVITPDFEQKESAPPISQSKHTRKKLVKVLILPLICGLVGMS